MIVKFPIHEPEDFVIEAEVLVFLISDIGNNYSKEETMFAESFNDFYTETDIKQILFN